MLVNGCDCSIVIKTTHNEMDIPFSDETLREAVTLLEEEAAIEGNGICRAIRKSFGITGCVITPLTIVTAPLLLCLAMGSAGLPEFVSETRNLYRNDLDLVPMEDTDLCDLLQTRASSEEQIINNKEKILFEGCRVKGFELRILREETIKLKLELTSEWPPVVYPYSETTQYLATGEERFHSDFVTYKIKGQDYTNIYGITLVSKKEGGTKTEIWIKRVLEQIDLPHIIDEMTITARLLRDNYEYRYFGQFRVTLKKLVLASDETSINSADSVIGPLRYYVAGKVSATVFSSEETI